MALYPAAVKRLIPPGSNDPRITPRVAILHVDAGGANGEQLYNYFRWRSGGIESHFTIDYDGTVTQFRDTDWQADANMQANNFAISIETQGVASGLWLIRQLDAIKELLSWLHDTHNIPLVKCPTWNGSGVGYHILFMAEWAGGPRSCPGPERIKQFHNDIVPWMASTKAPGSSIPNLPKPAPTPARSLLDPVRVRKLQALLEVGADGLWGNNTDTWAVRLRTAARAKTGGVSKPFKVAEVQKVINTTADGAWGPKSQAALVAWVKRVQSVLGVSSDGAWGPNTDAAFMRLRSNNFNKF